MTDPPRGSLTQEQVDTLLQPIKSNRIYHRDGHSNLAAWDVAAHLNRMFGFGKWEKTILSLDLIFEGRGDVDLGLKDKKNWYVTYRCQLRLRIFDEHGDLVNESDDVATGTAQNQPQLADAHDLACKNAVSYALKRCAKDLGDQFGLSLYNKGYEGAVVRKTLVGSSGDEVGVEVQTEGEGDDREPSSLREEFDGGYG